MDKECSCCRYKNTRRSEEMSRQLRNRINRIIGQLNGIQKMIDDNRYCGDILTQIAAAESAVKNVGYLILEDHMNTCVTEEIQNGNREIIPETVELIKKLG